MRARRIIKTFASLKFAVVIIVAMGTLIAWGTIVEAMYMDAKMAQETVYHSAISYGIFALFALTLIAVIIDRYPWKRHHVGFISAHVGILLLLIGSLVTRYYGVDGSMSLQMGGKNNQITVGDTELLLYTSLNGENFQKYLQQSVNFFRHPPSIKNPLKIPLPSGDIVFNDFYHYALVDSKIIPSDEKTDPPAVRFQISNDRLNQSEWILGKKNQFADFNMGPATIILNQGDYRYISGNVLVLEPISPTKLKYEVYSDKLRKKIQSGEVEAGGKFPLGWMNLEFRLLKYIHNAKQDIQFVKREQSSPEAISAVKFVYNGKEQWLGLNSMVRLFGNSEMYILTYGNRRIALDFDMYLKNFEVGRYQGTRRAASYESLVSIPAANIETKISMNEPLDYKGYTFYQASFEEDVMGKPTASVLSVNFDPGRWLKYLGSLLIVFGSIHLFYRRWKKARSANV